MKFAQNCSAGTCMMRCGSAHVVELGQARPYKTKNQMLSLTLARFGTAFGTHRFRHAVASSAPLMDPENPGLAAGLLGISRDVVQQNYNRANQVHAARTFDALMSRRAKILEAKLHRHVEPRRGIS